MKQNAFKKAFTVVLTIVMVFTFSACSQSNTNSDTTSKKSTSDASSKPSDAAKTDDSKTPFKSEVHLSIAVYDRGVEGVPNISDNYWTQWVQKNFGDKYNIKVEYVPITRTDVMTDYATLAAAKNLPVILMEYDYPKVAQWANDGYLTTFDMDDFAKAAPSYYKKMKELNLLDFTTMDGETYFALAERPYWDASFLFQNFVRMDWLKEVGYDHIPATYAETMDAMDKIIDKGLAKHPLGGSMITGADGVQNYGYRKLPQDELEWAMYSSVSLPALGWKPDHELLKRKNFEFNKGYMNPEFYITDAETEKAAFINGETYKYGGYMSADVDWLNSFYAQNPDAELAIEMPPTEPDKEGGTTPLYRADNPFGMIIGFSSFAGEDEIKAAWMYMEWMLQEDNLKTMQWGQKGENYNINEEGTPESVEGYEGKFKQGYNNNKDYWCIAIETRKAGTAEQMIEAVSPKGLPQDFTDQMIEYYTTRTQTAKAGYATIDPIFKVPMEEETEYNTTLNEMYKEFHDKLVMCDPKEFDALYQEFSKKYLDQGYQKVIDERKEAYEAGSSTKLFDNGD
jgi:putative aldouronate transport system substrate-binding protein